MSRSELTQAILRYIKVWEITPEKINDGFCGEFSAMVIESLGGVTADLYESFTPYTIAGHCWITFEGRHHDAECPEGVDSPHQLPFFLRHPTDADLG